MHPAPHRVAEQDTPFAGGPQVPSGISLVERVAALEQGTLPAVRGDAKVFIRQQGGDPSSWRAVQKTDLDEERFVDFLNGVGLFREGGGERVYPHRPALIFLDDGQQQLAVDVIETVLVDLEHLQGGLRRRFVNLPAAANLGVVPNAAKKAICDAGCPARAAGDLEAPSSSTATPRISADRSTMICRSACV